MLRCRQFRASLLLLLSLIGAPPATAATPLVLAVTVNGVETDAIVVEPRAGGLCVEVAELPALLPLANGAAELCLDRVPGLSYRLDTAHQTLAITLPPPAPSRRRAAPPVAEATPNGWGGYLNYDAVGTAVRGRASLDVALDMRVFSPRMLAFNGLVAHGGRSYFGQPALARLDSGVTLPDPRRTRRWTAGDFIGGGTSTSRPLRLGGIQLSTDFGLRPDLVTFPVPLLGDQAAVPSAVDVVADSAVRETAPSPAGSFSGNAPPVAVGLNSVNVVARDALGRESVRSLSFYASRALLLPGLSAVSLDLGFVRTGYATAFDRYRSLAAAATWRHGVSDVVTLEAHGEATRGLAVASAGATAGFGTAGTLYLAASASRGRLFERDGGLQLAAGWERLARPLSFSLRYVRGTPGFADVAAHYGGAMRRDSLVANLGIDLRRYGTVSAALIRLGPGRQVPLDARGRRIPTGLDEEDGRQLDRLTLLSGSAAVPLGGRFSLVANTTRALGRARSLSLSVGLLTLLGSRASAQAGVEQREGGAAAARLSLASPAVLPGDIGYRADLASGAFDRQAVQLEAIGGRGRAQLGLERVAGTVALRGGAQGAIVAMPTGIFRADRIDGSFALVDTDGQPGVPVFRENRPAGVTDRRGHLIVTGLLPYQSNRIGLDANMLDMDVLVETTERIVRPREATGATLGFGLRRAGGRVVRLIDASGQPLPAGARARLNDGPPLPIGLGGEVYLTDLRPNNRLIAIYDEARSCETRFTASATERTQAVLACRTITK